MFPGIANTDEIDAGLIARTAQGKLNNLGQQEEETKGVLPRRSCPSTRKFTALDANVTELDRLVADSLSRNGNVQFLAHFDSGIASR